MTKMQSKQSPLPTASTTSSRKLITEPQIHQNKLAFLNNRNEKGSASLHYNSFPCDSEYSGPGQNDKLFHIRQQQNQQHHQQQKSIEQLINVRKFCMNKNYLLNNFLGGFNNFFGKSHFYLNLPLWLLANHFQTKPLQINEKTRPNLVQSTEKLHKSHQTHVHQNHQHHPKFKNYQYLLVQIYFLTFVFGISQMATAAAVARQSRTNLHRQHAYHLRRQHKADWLKVESPRWQEPCRGGSKDRFWNFDAQPFSNLNNKNLFNFDNWHRDLQNAGITIGYNNDSDNKNSSYIEEDGDVAVYDNYNSRNRHDDDDRCSKCKPNNSVDVAQIEGHRSSLKRNRDRVRRNKFFKLNTGKLKSRLNSVAKMTSHLVVKGEDRFNDSLMIGDLEMQVFQLFGRPKLKQKKLIKYEFKLENVQCKFKLEDAVLALHNIKTKPNKNCLLHFQISKPSRKKYLITPLRASVRDSSLL
ncbi:hypothetical protein HELRODRAFT_159537 [Helobdella robusta]|uniref:Uncharacterized protein n=1 Tax=Helobdella robusta TaxID=6412 RepID=T1EP51_HELRO|nr:hypothetical protein HELRODRAFT_159537 [Helobdella robusta]ESO12945.1 hypothetical protein HELRODRAFT_159537 [Helobdella robusta]